MHHPNVGVPRQKRGSEPVASFDGRNEPLLIGEDGRQPQLAKQRVARSEAVVERALWSAFRRCVTESIVTAAGPRSQASVRAAARKPALSKRGRPIFLDYTV